MNVALMSPANQHITPEIFSAVHKCVFGDKARIRRPQHPQAA
jgi:hypothetical protein